MNKNELIAAVAEKADLTKAQAGEAIDAALEAITASLKAGDEVRLLVSTPSGHTHARFVDLPRFLRPGDLLVVNRSATLPASLPAQNMDMNFMLNLSTHYGHNLWLA